MMCWLVVVLLLVTLPTRIERDVRLVFVEPKGETFTEVEQAQALSNVEAAIEWWEQLSPISTTVTITATEVITVAETVEEPPWWINAYFEPSPSITILVMDNSDSGGELWGGGWAGANTFYDVILVTSTSTDLPNVQAALLAHELGHVLYDLPDLYTRGCRETDIMCNPITAYNARTIGCVSRAAMGAPCHRRYLAVVCA